MSKILLMSQFTQLYHSFKKNGFKRMARHFSSLLLSQMYQSIMVMDFLVFISSRYRIDGYQPKKQSDDALNLGLCRGSFTKTFRRNSSHILSVINLLGQVKKQIQIIRFKFFISVNVKMHIPLSIY